MAQNRYSHGSGPSQRQLRVGELIRRTLSDVLARADVHDPDLNRHSITVGEVRMSTVGLYSEPVVQLDKQWRYHRREVRRLHEKLFYRPLLTAVARVHSGEVRLSSDLKVATAFVLPLGGQGAEDALAALRRNTPELRHLVAKAMTLKYAPQLKFHLDETFDRMDDTRRLFADERVRRDVEAVDKDGDED